MYLKKEELKKIDFYETFDIPIKRLEWLFSYQGIPNSEYIPINTIFIENGFRIKHYNEFMAIRKAGKMFTYGYKIVPIKYYLIYYPNYYSKKTKQDKNINPGYFMLMMHCHTIDDAYMGISIPIKDEKEYKYWQNQINIFLEKYIEMPDNDEFRSYWEEKSEIININFN